MRLRLPSRQTTTTLAALSTVAAGVLYVQVGAVLSAPHRGAVPAAPEKLGTQEVTIESPSGARLSAWLMAPPSPKAAVVLLHGIRANRGQMLSRARLLWQAGYAVLAPDFQAHGRSTGDAITFGYRESMDAVAAIDEMKRRFPTLKVGAIGLSLGGAALAIAGDRVHADAVVLEAAYSTIEEATHNRIAFRVGSAAHLLAPLLLFQLRPRIGVATEALQPIASIGELPCPVLMIAGTADPYTTLAETERLFAAAKEPKELWLLPGARHVDLYRFDRAGYREHVLGFLDRYLAPAGGVS
jgi:dipeptidyl aminopeptidase/acylaminoacyl peptidase